MNGFPAKNGGSTATLIPVYERNNRRQYENIQAFSSLWGGRGLLRAEVVVIEELYEERVKMNYCMENIPRRKVAWN